MVVRGGAALPGLPRTEDARLDARKALRGCRAPVRVWVRVELERAGTQLVGPAIVVPKAWCERFEHGRRAGREEVEMRTEGEGIQEMEDGMRLGDYPRWARQDWMERRRDAERGT